MKPQVRTEKQGRFTFNYFPGYIEIWNKKEFVATVVTEDEKKAFLIGFNYILFLISESLKDNQ